MELSHTANNVMALRFQPYEINFTSMSFKALSWKNSVNTSDQWSLMNLNWIHIVKCKGRHNTYIAPQMENCSCSSAVRHRLGRTCSLWLVG